jgi:DNA-binding protein HU-beta
MLIKDKKCLFSIKKILNFIRISSTNKRGNNMSMTKSELLTYMAKKSGLSKKATGEFIQELVVLAYKEAKKAFVIPGLGKLVLVDRKARLGRNPKTGETIQIPAKKVVKFRIAKQAKDAILIYKK